MNKGKAFLALFLLAAGSSGGSSAPTAKARRAPPASGPVDIVLIGDSQTAPGGPGDHLAERLRAAGYKVQVIFKGGQNARYFAFGKGKAAVLELLKKRPRVFIVFLGTNELANIALDDRVYGAQIEGHQVLHDLIVKGGSRALFVGPPDFGPKVKGGGKDPLPIVSSMPLFVSAMKEVYGSDFIDARPYTPMPHNEIHFSNKRPKGAALSLSPSEAFAFALAPVVMAKL